MTVGVGIGGLASVVPATLTGPGGSASISINILDAPGITVEAETGYVH